MISQNKNNNSLNEPQTIEGKNGSPESNISENSYPPNLKYFENIGIYHFQDTGMQSHLRQDVSIHDNKILKQDGSNLPAFLFFLQIQYPKIFKLIEATVKSIAPFFKKFDLSLHPVSTEN